MKTKFLKWDVTLQSFLLVFNLVFTVIPVLWYLLLILQFFEGAYQLLSSFINVQMEHKSVGFDGYRHLHLIGSIVYIAFLCLLAKMAILIPDSAFKAVAITCYLIIPQAIFYSYFWLCRKELKYLERREFHILK